MLRLVLLIELKAKRGPEIKYYVRIDLPSARDMRA